VDIGEALVRDRDFRHSAELRKSPGMEQAADGNTSVFEELAVRKIIIVLGTPEPVLGIKINIFSYIVSTDRPNCERK